MCLHLVLHLLLRNMFTSSKSYVPGDVILPLQPIVYTVSAKSRTKRCNSCLSICDSLKLCSGCLVFQYCSQSCQKRDWRSFHKHQECSVFKKAREVNSSSNILLSGSELLMIRVYLTFQAKPDLMDKKYQLPNATSRSFNDLMSNIHLIEVDKERMVRVNSLLESLSEIIENFDKKLFLLIYGRICTNSYGIEDNFDINKVGHALLIDAAALNHSCKPNAVIISNCLKMQLRALTNIASGEEITVSYIGLIKKRNERRRELSLNWYFECNCNRCSSSLPDDDNDVIINDIERKEHEIRKIYSNKALDETQKSRKMLTLLNGFIKLHVKILGHFHPLITRLLLRAAKIALNTNASLFEDALNSFRSAVEVTHGTNHPMYQQFVDLKELFLCQSLLSSRVPSCDFKASEILLSDKWGSANDETYMK